MRQGYGPSEVAGLRVEDIDSGRGVILVRHGKGAKDRQRDAVAAASWHSSHLLAARQAEDVLCARAAMTRIRLIQPCCTQPAARRSKRLD